jgi:WD40 repeat protein
MDSLTVPTAGKNVAAGAASYILTGSADGVVVLWRLAESFGEKTLPDGQLVLSESGKFLARFDSRSSIRLYQAPFNTSTRELARPVSCGDSGEFSGWMRVVVANDGGVAASCGASVFFWPAGQSGAPLEAKLDGEASPEIVFSGADPLVAGGNKVWLWSPSARHSTGISSDSGLIALPDLPRELPLFSSGDGRYIFAIASDVVLFLDRAARQRGWTQAGGKPGIDLLAAAVSPDSRYLAVCHDSPDVGIVDLSSVRTIYDINLGSPCRTVAFNASSSSLAIGTERGILLADGATGREARRIPTDSPVRVLTFAGNQLAAAKANDAIGVYDLAGSQEPLSMEDRGVDRLAFSSDGQFLLAQGKGVRVFSLSLRGWIDEACERVKRDLTPEERAEHLPGGRNWKPLCTIAVQTGDRSSVAKGR